MSIIIEKFKFKSFLLDFDICFAKGKNKNGNNKYVK